MPRRSPSRWTIAPARRGSPPGSGPARCGRWPTPRAGPPISSGRDTSSPWRPRKAACCGGRVIPSVPWTWPVWRDCDRPVLALRDPRRQRGDRANRQQLFQLAAELKLEIISVEELIRYRRRSEKLVYRQAEASLPTALRPRPGDRVWSEVREPGAVGGGLRRSCTASAAPSGAAAFVLFHRRSVGLAPLRLRRPAPDGPGDDRPRGVRRAGLSCRRKAAASGWSRRSRPIALQDQGLDTVEANLALGHPVDSRDYGVGIQILKDLGLGQVRLLTNNPKKTDAFIYGGFDLAVVDQVPIVGPIHEHNRPLPDHQARQDGPQPARRHDRSPLI
jgi:3,4-dihydroxy 2-butanone 4-phosphate synthase/GTP cyclohydrolase II